MGNATDEAKPGDDSDGVWTDPEYAALERQRREHLGVESEVRSLGLLCLVFAGLTGPLLVVRSINGDVGFADLALVVAPFILGASGIQLRRLRPSGRAIFVFGGGAAWLLHLPFISEATWLEWVGPLGIFGWLITRMRRPGVDFVVSPAYRRRVMRVTPHLEPATSPIVKAAFGLLVLAFLAFGGLALLR